MKMMIPFICVVFIGATNVCSLPSLMSQEQMGTAHGSGCYQLKAVECAGGDSIGCQGMPCTYHEAQGQTIPATWKCEPTNETREVKQKPYDAPVPATAGQAGQDDHAVPDPDNPTDPSNYHQCVKKYTCSDCEVIMEERLVSGPFYPFFMLMTVEQGYCRNGPEHDTDTYDPEWQQLQVLTGEECDVPGPGTVVPLPIDP